MNHCTTMKGFVEMKKFFPTLTKENRVDLLFSEEDIHPLINDYPNSIIKLDVEGNILSFNKAFEKLFGYMEQDFKESIF